MIQAVLPSLWEQVPRISIFAGWGSSYAITLVLHFAGGVVRAGAPLVGLGIALTPLPVVMRWSLGFVAITLMSCLSCGSTSFLTLASLGATVSACALWVAIGLMVRAFRRVLISCDEQPPSRSGVSLGDLMMLTTAFALGFVLKWVGFSLLEPDSVVEADWFTFETLVILALSFGGYLLAPLPLLLALFPLGLIRMRLAFAGWLLAVLVVSLADFTSFKTMSSQFGTGGVNWFFASLLVGNSLGYATGFVIFALWLRWAGYRLRRIEPTPAF